MAQTIRLTATDGSTVEFIDEVIGSGGRQQEMVDMKVFVTGVGGQLGHDVVNSLATRGHEAVGSDIQSVYSGVADGSEDFY